MGVQLSRRGFIGSAAAVSLALMLPLTKLAAQTPSIPIPPPITREERLARLARARELMKAGGIGSVLVESGPSLDYYTGVQWWRSERLTGVVIPAQGDPIIVTPFFEKPSIEEMLLVPAEIRTWQEDEEPLKLVGDFLKERGVAGQPVAFEETNRFFILDRLRQQLPYRLIVSAITFVGAAMIIK